MLEQLKKRVYEQNMMLVKYGLVVLTWGNVSAVDRDKQLIVIKPSGVPYDKMKIDDMVVLDFDGNVVEGKLRPSSDTPTHIYLYKNFKDIGGIVHTHSTNAVAWAQAKMNIPAFGTTHADGFYGDVPCTRPLTKDEIEKDYELNTGKVIVETFGNIDYKATPAVLVGCHGPFTWGNSCEKAVENSAVLEEVAKMARYTTMINSNAKEIDKYLLDKHYFRKHGKNAYYGQGDN